jgi:hypothetical protein
LGREVAVIKARQQAEFDALTSEQQSLYYEATGCGATHGDAMEAAQTNGYTR